MTNESTLKMRTEKRHDSTAAQGEWLNGETLEMVRLYSGHFLALIANQPAAPHVPTGDLPDCKAKKPKWPLPTELVSGNEFLGDEWVYDPAIHGRILATDPDSDAVRCANHMIAGRTKAFLVLTSRRLAVAIDQDDIGPGDAEQLVTWWETARPQVGEVSYGRHHGNVRRFSAFRFADGSVLEIRHPG